MFPKIAGVETTKKFSSKLRVLLTGNLKMQLAILKSLLKVFIEEHIDQTNRPIQVYEYTWELWLLETSTYEQLDKIIVSWIQRTVHNSIWIRKSTKSFWKFWLLQFGRLSWSILIRRHIEACSRVQNFFHPFLQTNGLDCAHKFLAPKFSG